LDPFWTSLATIIAAAFVVVVVLAASGQPPVQANVPGDDMAYLTSVETDGVDGVVVAP
jgi:hypothetical protein